METLANTRAYLRERLLLPGERTGPNPDEFNWVPR